MATHTCKELPYMVGRACRLTRKDFSIHPSRLQHHSRNSFSRFSWRTRDGHRCHQHSHSTSAITLVPSTHRLSAITSSHRKHTSKRNSSNRHRSISRYNSRSSISNVRHTSSSNRSNRDNVSSSSKSNNNNSNSSSSKHRCLSHHSRRSNHNKLRHRHRC